MSSLKAPNFANLNKGDSSHLPRREAFTSLVYGPVQSRRFGRSLGINILGTEQKACSFDCAYCDLGATTIRLNRLKSDIVFPTVDAISEAVNASLKEIHANGPNFDMICLSGNGEPTLHPDFNEVVKSVMQARETWMPDKPIAVLTNGAHLDSRKVVDAMNKIDQRIVKIDAGNERAFKVVNSPLSRTTLAKVISGVRSLKDVTIQALFVQGATDNTSHADIEDWIEVIAIIKPKTVQIHGISRQTTQSGLIRCDEDTLYAIASRLERKTQIKAIVTP
jgi:wyosine [tRNA(Phe)-imidazoG37] synthetase (radical SAM superfamily)